MWGTASPKDRNEVKRREVSECQGGVCDLETIGVPSIFKLIRRSATLGRIPLWLRGMRRTPCDGNGTPGWMTQAELLTIS